MIQTFFIHENLNKSNVFLKNWMLISCLHWNNYDHSISDTTPKGDTGGVQS